MDPKDKFSICYKSHLQDPILASQTLPIIQDLFEEYKSWSQELEEIGKQSEQLNSEHVMQCTNNVLLQQDEFDDDIQEKNFTKCYRDRDGTKDDSFTLATTAFRATRKHFLASNKIIKNAKVNVTFENKKHVKTVFNYCRKHFAKYN